MATPYVGEIRLGGWNFAPVGWAFCNGQLLPISEYDVLFTLIGTTYGGDGISTFALPNLQGRVPVHAGPGFALGQLSGSETVTLNGNQAPTHGHQFMASIDNGSQGSPVGYVPAAITAGSAYIQGAATSALAPGSIPTPAGAALPHDNMQPYLGITFIIALYGVYPTQN